MRNMQSAVKTKKKQNWLGMYLTI